MVENNESVYQEYMCLERPCAPSGCLKFQEGGSRGLELIDSSELENRGHYGVLPLQLFQHLGRGRSMRASSLSQHRGGFPSGGTARNEAAFGSGNRSEASQDGTSCFHIALATTYANSSEPLH